MGETAAHAYLPPSAAEIWSKCSAFGLFNAANPYGLQGDTDATVEGTLAHDIVHRIATGDDLPENPDVTEEMIECANWFVEELRTLGAFRAPNGPDFERRLLPTLMFGDDVWGTPDAIWFDENGDLHVGDYKFGHLYVPVAGNLQLSSYAILKLTQHVNGKYVPLDQFSGKIHFHIGQPRCFIDQPMRTWSTDMKWLTATAAKLGQAANEARVNPTERTGEHCRYCPGRLSCKTFRAQTSHAVEMSMAHTGFEPADDFELSMQLSVLRQARSNLEAMLSAAEAVVENKLTTGQAVFGFQLSKPKKIGATWDITEEEVEKLADQFDVPIRKPAKLLTPTQAVKAGMPPEILEAVCKPQYSQRKIEPTNNAQLNQLFRPTAK